MCRTPDLYFSFCGFQAFLRSSNIVSTSSKEHLFPSIPTICNILLSISISTKSFSSIKAIGPPSAASGDTCPIAGPFDAPEKRPSVIKAMELANSGSEDMAS